MRVLLLVSAVVSCSSPPPPRPAASAAAMVRPARGPVPERAPVPGPDPAPPALRLPGDVRPTGYALDLAIVPEQGKAAGVVTIDLEIVRPTRVVWLNATGLSFGKATLDGRAARVIAGGEDFVGVAAGRELAPGRATLALAYEAPIDRTKSRGIYAEHEGADTYAYTFFEPIDARRALPCFDEPAYKVPWQLTLHVKREHVALANAAVVREVDEPGGMKRVELAPTRPLPSYLVAFVVGPFELVDGGVAGRARTPVRFVIPKGRAGELGWARQITPHVVAALEDYFDMDYPYGKLDVAVVPRFWGTMEHPGIVAMGQPLTLIRPEQETRSRKQAYANTLAHELAHYWFGDLVTMAWWDDTWLNEALGEWMDMIITEAVEPGWRHRDDRVRLAITAMASDEALATQAIRRPVESKQAIEASFDNAITYDKGASVLRMFEAASGALPWRDFIRSYLRAHAWGSASADDLLGALRARLGARTEAAMRSFLEQPGVPRISAELVCAPRRRPRLVLHQQRALPAGVIDPAPKLWQLPVCVRYGGAQAHRACVQLEAQAGELVLDDGAPAPPAAGPGDRPAPPPAGAAGCPTWLILNADAAGYYRSVVDPATARALLTPGSAIAKAARPTAAEKMMLVADLGAMVDRDELPIDRLLELVPLVAADRDEKVALWAFTAVRIRADVLDDAYHARARRYLARTFGPAARQLGWARGPNDSDERHELRRSFVPVVADSDPALRKQAEVLADRWLASREGVDDELVSAVLRVAARRGTLARFDRVLAAARAAPDRTELRRLLGTLGAFRDPAIARRALELVAGTELDLRDSLGILYGVVFQRETRALAAAFLRDHIDALLTRMRDDEAAGFLGALAGGTCTSEQRAAMAELVEPRAGKYSGALAPVRRGLEQSARCIARTARELPAVKRFLDRY